MPFTVRLLDCSVDVSRTVGIQFQGMTPAEDPQVFRRHRGRGKCGQQWCRAGAFDEQQRQIIPNATAVSWLPINTRELVFHFSARYRAISEHLVPGTIQSNVWFTLIYP